MQVMFSGDGDAKNLNIERIDIFLFILLQTSLL